MDSFGITLIVGMGEVGRPLHSILNGHDPAVLGIDIGASSVKIVQLRPSRGAAILETYGEIALAPYAQQPIGKPVKLTPEVVGAAIVYWR